MVLAIDEDRAHRQLRRLERAERPLDVRQALVGLDRLGSPQGGALQARPDDVYAVQLRLRVDLVLLPRPADLGVGHLDGEVLIHFFAADVAPHPPVDRLLGALVSQTGVETDQQALAGKVRAADLGDPVGLQLARRQRGPPGALRVRLRLPQQLADGVRLQGRDPGQAGWLEAEALLDLLHLHPDRARIRRVAGEHIYGHGTAVGRAEQAADDLLLALLAVPVVAERGQWRTAPLQIAGRDIVEQQGGALEMPSGEALLDPRLPPQQPVEHVEHFVAADGTEAEQGTEAAGGGLRGQAASGGELGAGLEYAGDYGGEGEVTPAAAGALQEALEAKLSADAEDGADMAMGQGAADAEGLLAGAIDLAAAEHGADAVDDLGGQFGEVGEGGAADALAVALGLAEEDGGGGLLRLGMTSTW